MVVVFNRNIALQLQRIPQTFFYQRVANVSLPLKKGAAFPPCQRCEGWGIVEGSTTKLMDEKKLQ